MSSIFHVQASTAEELRTELVKWLEDQELRYESQEFMARTIKEKAINQAKIKVVQNAAEFWRTIIIDPTEPEE